MLRRAGRGTFPPANLSTAVQEMRRQRTDDRGRQIFPAAAACVGAAPRASTQNIVLTGGRQKQKTAGLRSAPVLKNASWRSKVIKLNGAMIAAAIIVTANSVHLKNSRRHWRSQRRIQKTKQAQWRCPGSMTKPSTRPFICYNCQ
jgi:hypothetical protein